MIANRLFFFLLSATVVTAVELAPLSPFGIGGCHINNRTAADNARWIPQMAAIGVSVHRCAQTSWGAVEPEEGRWTFAALDAQMDYLEAQGFSFGGILMGSPKWNTKDAPGTLPVNNLAAWSRYVSAVVGHAKGRIKYWEVWNEPPNGTGKDQTAADYAKIVVAAYDAAKSADPECLIGLAAKSVHINYLDQAIVAGAKGHYDCITLHPYEVMNSLATNLGMEPVYLNIVPIVRRMLAVRDPAKRDVPVIFTELGCDAEKKGSEAQAQSLVKAYTMGIAQGVSCIQWFEGRDGDSGPMGLMDRQGTPRPAYHAMARMIEHFGHQPEYLGWVLLANQHYGFIFRGAKTSLLVAWAAKGKEAPVDFGEEMKLLDVVTGSTLSDSNCSLTAAPMMVLGVPEKFIAQAKANLSRPLPWGGDFSGAESVSVTMGKVNQEQGL
ncbi:MAG: beta-galactosidase, partial [Verrucomicrobiales bacterium]|nr:beta-galactosidase [Verrucomicrobiales bacterium]